MAVNPNRSRFALGVIAGYASDSDYLTATGSTPKRGDFYYNTALQSYKVYNGSIWTSMGGVGGSGGGLVKVRLHDPVSTTLPTGDPTTVDDNSVDPGDLVLFSNLSSGGDQVYRAVGTGTDITGWTAEPSFSGIATPTDGDVVIITDGASFADQIGVFDGNDWVFNNKIRAFNGADYLEISAINSVALANNQSSPADIFSVGAVGSENMIIDYSIIRGTAKETGQIYIVNDGTSVQKSETYTRINNPAVALSADINAGNVRLRYTSDNSGSTGVFKFSVKRWSDGTGGPGGLASYSVAGSTVTGSGATQQMTVWSSGTALTGNANFTIDTSALVMKLGSGSNIAEHTVLNADSVSSGVNTNALLFTYPDTYRYVVVEYSVDRGAGNYRLGTLLITHDGTTPNVVDTYTEVGSTQVTLASPTVTHTIAGGNVEIRYTTAGGSAGTFKRLIRRWQ